MLSDLELLQHLLTSYGIFTVSTGSKELLNYYERRYQTTDRHKVEELFHKELEKIRSSKILFLGVPCDNGAALDRGSKKGPFELRKHIFLNPHLLKQMEKANVLDIGDIWDHPSLIEDSYYQPHVLKQVHHFRWPDLHNDHHLLPVAPYSILKKVVQLIYKIHPEAKILMVGGDHSYSRVPVEERLIAFPEEQQTLGVLHIDAHTDLLAYRQGLDISYGTWAYWANEALKRDYKLVQVGIRQSGKPKEYWEQILKVKQFWAKDINSQPAQETIEEIIRHYHALGIEKLYLSIDIDGVCPSFCAATGTPEANGLTPIFIKNLLEHVSQHFEIVGADMMEVAPSLSRSYPEEPQKTINTASALIFQEIQSMTGKIDTKTICSCF